MAAITTDTHPPLAPYTVRLQAPPGAGRVSQAVDGSGDSPVAGFSPAIAAVAFVALVVLVALGGAVMGRLLDGARGIPVSSTPATLSENR